MVDELDYKVNLPPLLRSSENRILGFPKKNQLASSSSVADYLASEIVKNPQLKNFIESVVYGVMVKEKILNQEMSTDPYEALYICDLEPDLLNIRNVKTLKAYSQIIDRSDEIRFNDGMDD